MDREYHLLYSGFDMTQHAAKRGLMASNELIGLEWEPGNHLEPNEPMIQALEIRTTIRNWQYRIREFIDKGEWLLSDCTDYILAMSVYGDVDDGCIAKKVTSFGAIATDHDVAYVRAKAAWVLMRLYEDVLGEYVNEGNRDMLGSVVKSVEQKVDLLETYIETEGSDEPLGRILERHIREGHLGRIIAQYIDLRSDIFAEQSETYRPVSELEKVTGYSNHHLRTLIRIGQVAGTHTDAGWFGSEEAVLRYRSRPKRLISVGAPRKPRKR